MVHKKYTYKNGKKFGPYLYETKRVDGKIVTTYLGHVEEKKYRRVILPFAFLILLGVLLLSSFYFFGLTGRVGLDINTNYNPGEQITGSLNLNVKEGELIPFDSKIIIDFNGEEKEFFLSELIDSETIEGNFYAEGTGISGSGEGYGLIGKKKVYPEVEFELKLLEDGQESQVSGSESGSDSGEENGASEEEPAPENGLNEGTNDGTGEIGEGTGETGTNDGTGESTGEIGEGTEGGTSEGGTGESDASGDSGDSGGSDSGSGDSGSSESSGDSGASDSGGGSITGAVISESGILSGTVTADKAFEYNIAQNQDAELIPGSVKSGGEQLDDGEINVKVRDNRIEVGTDYFIEEEGFGEDFLGNGDIRLSIDVSELGLIAENNSLLSIRLVYGDENIVEAEKDISVAEEVIESINETIANETIINKTITNETIVNQTLINETLSNISIGDVNVSLVQYGAVLGQPVKWKKRVDLNAGPATVNVEIPKEAVNVSIRKLDEKDEENEGNEETEDTVDNENEEEKGIAENESSVLESEIEANQATAVSDNETSEKIEEEVSVDISGSVISGRVTADIELEKESKIMKFFDRLLKFTGLAVSEEKDVQEITVELNETEDVVEIEYYTDAPSAIEEESNRGKTIRVSGPDNVHYQNVLIFTELNESFGISSPEKVRIYWQENDSYLSVQNASDLDDNGIYDYLEFIAPHLSNQTFEIIVITNAEHLDANRTFISDIYPAVSELDGNWSEEIGDGDYVRVVFEMNLTQERDITVYPRTVNGTPKIEIYELDGNEIVAQFDSLKDNEYNKVYLIGWGGEQDTFDLRVLNGSVEFDHIIDPIEVAFTDDFEAALAKWDGNGATAWDISTAQKHAGTQSVLASNGNEGDIITDDIDLSAATFVNISFWFMDDDLDNTDIDLYAYNGSTYNRIDTGQLIGIVATEDTWALWSVSSSDSQYFKSNFRLRFNAVLGTGENLWLDDVYVNITTPDPDNEYPIFSGFWDNNATLSGNGTALFNVTVTSTNGTVGLEINGTNYTASNLTAGTFNVSVSFSSGTYSYYWFGWGNGTDANYNTSRLRSFTINETLVDTTPPLVTINLPANATYNTTDLPLNFNVTLNENGSVLYSLNGGINNFSMTANASGTGFNASNASLADGSYTFRVYANDSVGNKNYTENVLFSFLTENYTANVTINDAIGAEINSTIVFRDLDTGEIVYNMTNKSHSGLRIPAGLYNITVNPLDIPGIQRVKLIEADIHDDVPRFMGLDKPADIGGFHDIFAVDLSFGNFTNGTLTFNATSELLYKCQNWNFTMQECIDDNWTILMSGLIVGQTYDFPIYPGDPGYGFINITAAVHLDGNYTFISDIFPQVGSKDGVWSEDINDSEYVRVTFVQNLTSINDITIYPRNISGAPRVEVYEKNKSTILAGFDNPIDNQYNTIYLTNLTGSQDVFDLRVVSGTMQFDHIIDPSSNYLVNTDGDANGVALGGNGDTLGKNIIRLDTNMLIAEWIDGTNDASCADSTNEGVTWGTYDSLTGTHADAAIATNGSAIVYVFVDNGQFDLSYVYNTTADCNIARSGTMTDLSLGTNDNMRPDVTFDGVNNRFVVCSMDNDDFDLDLSITNLGATLSWSTSSGIGGARTIESCSVDVDDTGNVFGATDDASINAVVVFNSSEFATASTVNAYNASVSGLHMSIRGTNILITAIDASNSLVVLKSSNGQTYTNATYSGGTFDDAEGCLDENGNAHIVFKNGTSPSNIEYVRYNAAGSFDNREIVADGGGTVEYRIPSVRCTNFPSNNRLGSELEFVYQDIGNTDIYFANVTIDTSVPDTTAPGVNISSPVAEAYYGISDLPLFVNASLNENGSAVLYSFDAGINNVSMSSTNNRNYNASNASIAAGSYTASIYANDTVGNKNYTEGAAFTFDNSNPGISFVAITPDNNTKQNDNFAIYVNLSTSDNNGHYSLVDFNKSLVLWARMDNTNGSGDPTDLSTYSNNGSRQGDAVRTDRGYFGDSFAFDSTGDYIDFSSASSLSINTSSGFTWAAWIYIDSPLSSVRGIFDKGAAGSATGASLRTDLSNKLSFQEYSTPTIVTGNLALSTNTWYHAAAVYNGTAVLLYLNGTLDKSQTVGVVNDTANKLFVGRNAGGNYMNGNIDEAMMFSRALSASEIGSLFNSSGSKYENNFTSLGVGKYVFTGYAVDKAGNKNQTEERTVIVRNGALKISETLDCNGLLTKALILEQGINYTATCQITNPSLNSCVALNADLNITSLGRIDADSKCGIFFNSSSNGQYQIIIGGTLNFSEALMSAVNTSVNYNFSLEGTPTFFLDSRGVVQRFNLKSPANFTDSKILFSNVNIQNNLIFINSTDLSAYTVNDSSSLYRKFRLNVTVKDSSGNLLPGVNVTAWNSSNSEVFSLLTNANGVAFYNLTQYSDLGTGKIHWNNYTINHTKAGYKLANSTSLNISSDTALALILELYDTIVVSTTETPHDVFTRINDPVVFGNMSDSGRICRYASRASINVTTGGKFVLDNCTLEMNNSLTDGEFNLYISSGGIFIGNNSNITAKLSTKRFEFRAQGGSQLILNNSHVSYIGSGATDFIRGLAINTTNVTFVNTTISEGITTDIELFSGAFYITDSKLLGGATSEYNIYCVYCDNLIVQNSNLSTVSEAGASVVVLNSQTAYVLNSNYSTHNVQAGGRLFRQWYVDSYVNDTAAPLAGAFARFYNNTNDLTNEGLTNITGVVRQNISEYVINGTAGGGAKISQGNYSINATKLGYTQETKSMNITNNLILGFNTLVNGVPYFRINSLGNNSGSRPGVFNITLNITAYDLYGDEMDFRIYGINQTATSNFYKHGLIYRNNNVSNNTEMFYNWTSPVIVPDLSTLLLLHLDNLSERGENNTKVYDSVKGNNGTLFGNGRPKPNTGKLAGAFELDGESNGDYIEIPHSSNYNVSVLTAIAWIYPYSQGANGYLLSKDDQAGNTGFWLSFDYGTNNTLFEDGSGTSVNSTVNSLVRNVWQQIAVTLNTSTITFYVNGQQAGINPGSFNLSNNTNVLTIGSRSGLVGGPGALGFNGSIDEIAIFNRTLSAVEIEDFYRLREGKYFWKVNISDTANSNESETRDFTILSSANNPANNPTPEINSTDGSNKTAQNLHCFDTLIDPDGDTMSVTVVWYNDSGLRLQRDYNNSYANNTLFDGVLDSANTTKGQNWTCGLRVYDGTDYSSWVNTTGRVLILNSPPSVPSLSGPADGSSTTDRTPTFDWGGGSTDDDDDDVSYDINLTCLNTAGGGCSGKGDDNRLVISLLGTTHTILGDLQYFIDNNNFYNWTVRAYDGQDYSSWQKSFKLNISSLLQLNLTNSSVEFGALSFLGSNNTDSYKPGPFTIQNDGNAMGNISIEATDLWSVQANPSSYYQFKADNTSEIGSFDLTHSTTIYTNIFAWDSPSVFLVSLNYTDFVDSAEIDLNVTVPEDEGPNLKNSSVRFTISLGE